MHAHTIGRKTLIATGVLVAAVTAGCGTGATDAGSSPGTTTPSASSAGQPVTTSTTAPPATSAEVPQPTRAPADAEAADGASSSSDCKAADLTLSIKDGDAAAGTVYRKLVFTNSGDRTCTIQGFPGVSYVAGDDGHQVGPAAYRVGEKGAPVTLNPGGDAAADIGFTNVQNFDPSACQPTETRGLRIYPPHDTAAMFVPLSGTGCSVPDLPGQNNQLTVKTVVG
ncbi:DUF4232 domain-containing protein [Actinokineospora pegani]|uniref:DUF4232 domain-containing protein n=1 Tax=Actinokineospora pegani TaxID=2654637 RepID=UPI001F46F3E5|nr:DUF4232 domain-containing protein [Actinokineospora pegani]